MKSEKEIQYDIQYVMDKIRDKSTPALRVKLSELTQVIRYVSTNPSPEFVRQQLEMTETKIRKILEAGPKRENYKFEEGYKKDMKKYEKDEGVDRLRKQKKTLEYILNL